METIFKKFTKLDFPLEEKDLVELALSLRTIGPNFNTVMLLYIT